MSKAKPKAKQQPATAGREREVQFLIRTTADEMAEIEGAAEHASLPKASWARSVLLREARKAR